MKLRVSMRFNRYIREVGFDRLSNRHNAISVLALGGCFVCNACCIDIPINYLKQSIYLVCERVFVSFAVFAKVLVQQALHCKRKAFMALIYFFKLIFNCST